MAHTACSGRNDGRSSPTECRNLSHWQSYTSVRLPGTVQMRKGNNRAEQMFRLAANSLHHNNTPLGEYLRRMKAKLGPVGAITATARKIAIIFYTMVKNQVEYDATLWAQRDAQREKRFEEKLKRQAHQRGYKLVPIEEKPAAQGTDLQGSAKEFLERRWPVPRLSLVVVVYYRSQWTVCRRLCRVRYGSTKMSRLASSAGLAMMTHRFS